jgi:hypothetical protein
MKGKSNKLWKHLHNVSGCENHGTAMTLNDCDDLYCQDLLLLIYLESLIVEGHIGLT